MLLLKIFNGIGVYIFLGHRLTKRPKTRFILVIDTTMTILIFTSSFSHLCNFDMNDVPEIV